MIQNPNIFEMASFTNNDFVSMNQETKSDQNPASLAKEPLEFSNPFRRNLSRLESEFRQIEEDIKVKTIEELYNEGIEEAKDDQMLADLRKLDQRQRSGIATQTLARSETIQNERKSLPVFEKEDQLLDKINSNLVTVVCGETGSGKSTQVPQILYEYGYGNVNGPNPGKIGVTQPRRLAAISLAKRVGEEMGDQLLATYQVRFESGKSNEKTRLKFMTDGILLNEMMSDFLLNEYSVIILDEIHERKINTDILLGLLSRIVRIRCKLALKEREASRDQREPRKSYKYFPLRLVLMSATIRAEDFIGNKKLFPDRDVPQVNIEARQYPVSIMFAKATKEDYVKAAVSKCVKIHEKLPPGAILVFLTGENEIKDFCKLVKAQLKASLIERLRRKRELGDEGRSLFGESLMEIEKEKSIERAKKSKETMMTSERDEMEQGEREEESQEEIKEDFRILPLYSKLSLKDQEKVWRKQEGKRLIIASTNIAETSLTIPDVKYVVDSGKEKVKVYNRRLSVIKYAVGNISQSSAMQRSGRAGRTGPGHCYRLYSTAVYSNLMAPHSTPEILKSPLDFLVLQLKAIGIQDAINFPFVSSPPPQELRASIQKVMGLEGLTGSVSGSKDSTKITPLGRILAFIPLHPVFSKFILLGRAHGLLGYTIILSSCLGVPELLRHPQLSLEKDNLDDQMGYENPLSIGEKVAMEKKKLEQKQQERGRKISEYKKSLEVFCSGESELFMVMNMLGGLIKEILKTPNPSQIDQVLFEYTKKNSMIYKSVKEAYRTVLQIVGILNDLLDNEKEVAQVTHLYKNYLNPNEKQCAGLKRLLVRNFPMQLARKVEYLNQRNKRCSHYDSLESSEPLHLQIHSFFLKNRPQFLIYTSIFEAQNKNYLSLVTCLEDFSMLFEEYPDSAKFLEEDTGPRSVFYSRKSEKFFKVFKGTFTKLKWEVSPILKEVSPKEGQFYLMFARHFLQGNVLPGMKVLVPL